MGVDEDLRLRTLQELAILDSEPEEAFDRITRLASELFGAPMSVVSLLDDKRQWFKSRVGIRAAETPREFAFCAHAIKNETGELIVEDAHVDARFQNNPLVTGDPNIRFYAGSSVQAQNGSPLGTLCVMDTKPRTFTIAEQRALRALAQVVSDAIALRSALSTLSEREAALRISQQELQTAHDALSKKEALWTSILDNAGEGIVAVDSEGRFTVYNRAAKRLTRVDNDLSLDSPRLAKAAGGSDSVLYHRDGVRRLALGETPILLALRGRADTTEEILAINDGKKHYIEVTSTALRNSSGIITGAVAVMHEVTALREAELRLTEMAKQDALTSLPNRRSCDEKLQEWHNLAQRDFHYSVALVDIDWFKRINDSHGHEVGDEVLIAVGKVLRNTAREADFVGRYGGEEFLLLLHNQELSTLSRSLERFRAAVAATAAQVSVTASFGATSYVKGCTTLAMLRTADSALYRAKRRGRNIVETAECERTN